MRLGLPLNHRSSRSRPTMLECPSARHDECRPEPRPVRAQMGPVLYFDELCGTVGAVDEVIRGVASRAETIPEGERDGLRDDGGGRVKKARQSDEVTFEGTLVFGSAYRKRPEADDMKTSAERNPPQSPSGFGVTQYTIMAHFELSSKLRNKAYAPNSLFQLRAAVRSVRR